MESDELFEATGDDIVDVNSAGPADSPPRHEELSVVQLPTSRKRSASRSNSPDKREGTESPPLKNNRGELQESEMAELLSQGERSSRRRKERSIKLSALPINPRVLAILEKMKLKMLWDVLAVTPIDLRNASLTEPEVDDLFLQVAATWWDSNLTRYRLSTLVSDRVPRLGFGCPVLDGFFHGGIISNQLTEIAGAAGTGKTQICLLLALRAQLPVLSGGLGGETLYICTETFPGKRLRQMTDEMARNLLAAGDRAAPSTDRIYIEVPTTIDEIETFLSSRVHDLLNRVPIKLIILDSIANIFRYQTGDVLLPLERAVRLQRIAVTLRQLQNHYGITLVCSNQVSAVIEDERNVESKLTDENRSSEDDVTVSALGIAWSNFVTTRVMLQKTYQIDPKTDLSLPRRTMKIVFSPHLPQTQVGFEVVTDGVHGKGRVEISF